MNRLLLFVGSFLLLVLTMALIAPRFVDWSNYTAVIEEQASRVLGRQVVVSGDVDLRFLPMPRITFTDIEIAADAQNSQPGFRARRVEALMSLAPFLSGETHIVELTLDQPVVRLAALEQEVQGENGGNVDLGAVSIDDAIIVDGRIERVAADGTVQTLVESLNASLSAPSLLGPWRVDPASAIVADERVTLRVNTGAYGGDRRMRLRVSALPANRPMELAIDGHLDWSQSHASFEGRGLARSLDELVAQTAVDEEAESPAITWRVEADVVAALDALDAQGIELTLGQEQDQAFVLNGHASVDLGERPAFNAQMSSRQVDLDRMLGGGAANPVDLGTGWGAAGTLVRWIDTMNVPGDLDFDLPAIVIGGSVIRDIRFDATYRPGLPLSLNNLVATFPGQTDFSFTGAVGAVGLNEGTDLAIDGIMRLASEAPDLFVAWSTGRREEGGTFSQLSSMALQGRVVAQPGDIRIERLRGDVDGDALEGGLTYQQIAGLGGQLDVALAAGRFDFALLSGLGTWLSDFRSPGADTTRVFDTIAADLSVGELLAGAENLGEVRMVVEATPEQVQLEQITIGDAAGATISAQGTLARGAFPPMGELTLNADMDRIGGLARLARDIVGDHPVVLDLIRNASLYEPASFAGTYMHTMDAGLDMDVAGEIGGTDVTLSASMATLEGEGIPSSLNDVLARAGEVRFDAQAEDAFVLIGQMGIAALPVDLGTTGQLSASLLSDGETDAALRLAFDGLDTTVRLDGNLVQGADASPDDARHLVAEGTVFVGDLAQMALMAGMAVPGLFDPISSSVQFDLDLDFAEQNAQLSELTGLFADIPVRGSAQVSRGPLGTAVALDLDADRADLPQILAGFVGPAAFDQGFSETWPEGTLVFNPVPIALDLSLSAPRFHLWGTSDDGLVAQNSELRLKAENGSLVLDSLQGQIYGGTLDGRLVLRDAQPGAIAEGRVTLDGLNAARFAWERAGQPVINGEVSANLSFQTAGGSIASLIGGLTGEGTLALADTEISGLGLSGFARILQASDAGLFDENDDLEAAFLDALNVGTMRVVAADTPLSVAGGIVSLSNLYVGGESTALRGGLTADLSTSTIDADFSFAATEGPGDVEAMPNVGLSYSGALAAPVRQLDVSQVASFLNVRQLEREIERVEALNAEILERERLLRIMGAIDLDQERRAFVRDEAERLEQERREAEQRRLDAIEADRRATQEAARQAEAAREQALREALLARERDLLNPNTPSALDLTLPGVVQPANALQLGENPPAATSAPLDLTPR